MPSQVKYPFFCVVVTRFPFRFSCHKGFLCFRLFLASLVNSFCFFVEDFPLKFSFKFFSHFIHLSEESFLAFSIPMPVTLCFFWGVNPRYILCLLSSSLLTNEHFYYRSSIHIWIHFLILQVL